MEDGLVLDASRVEVELDTLRLEDVGEVVGGVAGHRVGSGRVSN